MERTTRAPTYAVNVTHNGLHLLYMALDLALAFSEKDDLRAIELARMFDRAINSSQARRTSAIATRRAISEAHRAAVSVDGHGSEFASEPLKGTELADAMSLFDETLRKYDAAIAASIEQEGVESNEQGKINGDLV
jgi:hypothetical protein